MKKITKRSQDKKKIGTILRKDVVKKIKEYSAKEGKSMSEIIEEAILKYDLIN